MSASSGYQDRIGPNNQGGPRSGRRHRTFKYNVPETKIAEFANSVDLDEVAHDEPPHQDLHYLPSSL